jgi:signal transduction histidine kinase
MKLFGERVLGGVVDFESSEADGTVFTFTLPKKMRP